MLVHQRVSHSFRIFHPGSHQIPGGRPGESQQHWQRLRVGGRAAVLVGGVGEVHGDAAGEAEVRVPAAMSQPQGGLGMPTLW